MHRLVKQALGVDGYRDTEVRPAYIDALARQSSWLERRSEDAERDLDARKGARYLAARLGETFPAVVVGAFPGGINAQLLDVGIEGLIPLRVLGDDFYQYDAARLALVGSRSGRVLGIGLELRVRVVSVEIERNDVVLEPAATPEAPVATDKTKRVRLIDDIERKRKAQQNRRQERQSKRGKRR